MTGWAQIHGRNTLDWEEKFRLDVWYVIIGPFGWISRSCSKLPGKCSSVRHQPARSRHSGRIQRTGKTRGSRDFNSLKGSILINFFVLPLRTSIPPPANSGIERLGFARHRDADGLHRQLWRADSVAPPASPPMMSASGCRNRSASREFLHVGQVHFKRPGRNPYFIPAEIENGRWKCAPMPARTTFGAKGSVVSGGRKTACTPAAAAVRRSVPRLPGSRIRVGNECKVQRWGRGSGE